MSLTLLQQRFLENWRQSGRSVAKHADLISGDLAQHTISVVCEDRVGWRFEHVGSRHTKVNGLRLEGEVVNALPFNELEDRLGLYEKLVSTGVPVSVEEIGVTGLSQHTWTSRIFVDAKPPKGASAAIVGICEWQDRCEALESEILTDIVARVCPEWIVKKFESAAPETMRTRAKVLQMILQGDFGRLSNEGHLAVARATQKLKKSAELSDLAAET